MKFITNPYFYLAAVPAVLLASISKGGFAGLAVPLMAPAIPAPQAASVVLRERSAGDALRLRANIASLLRVGGHNGCSGGA